MFSSTFKALAIAAAVAHPAAAWFRIPCTTPVVTERVDPIINPNQFPTNHIHTVQGGQNFFANSTYDTLSKSSCTTCVVTEDKSSYWYPKLYFKSPSTSKFEAVPNGGLDVYYLFRGDGDKKAGGAGLKAFPPGLRMISGSPTRRGRKFAVGNRSSQAALAEDAIEWSCIGGDGVGYDYKSGVGFPHGDCPGLFRADVQFPSCWNGVDLDSPNHTDHVAYLSDLDNGKCPDTHPVPFIHLFYETFWDVHSFVVSGKWDGTGFPFVWATGDPTGYSFHADFYNGWEDGVLQKAIDQCDSTSDQLAGVIDACPVVKVQDQGIATKCKSPLQVNESIDGPFDRLPGCNPLQAGPGDSTLYSDSNCPI